MAEMTFDEFCKYAEKHIAEHLSEFVMERDPQIKTVNKNNGVICTGLLISDRMTGNVAPNIYLEYYYQRYRNEGLGADHVLEMIADEFRSVRTELVSNIDFINNEQWMNDITFVFPKLVSLEKNRAALKDAPFVPFQDLAVTFRIKVDMNQSGVSSIMLKQEQFEKYGKSLDELYDIAMDNYRNMFPPKIHKLEDLLGGMIGIPSMTGDFETNAYVVTNSICVNGATSILDKDVLADVHEKMGGEFFILPSSVHECILVPAEMGGDANMLAELVREVNREVLSETDFLSDTVYRYDGETREITMVNPPEWVREKDREQQTAEIDMTEQVAQKKGLYL